jgi:23S rRNA-/tRNA-specific pseudouridylate synthase
MINIQVITIEKSWVDKYCSYYPNHNHLRMDRLIRVLLAHYGHGVSNRKIKYYLSQSLILKQEDQRWIKIFAAESISTPSTLKFMIEGLAILPSTITYFPHDLLSENNYQIKNTVYTQPSEESLIKESKLESKLELKSKLKSKKTANHGDNQKIPSHSSGSVSKYWRKVEVYALSLYEKQWKKYLSIIYYDDDLIVVNKPSALLSVPSIDPKRLSMYHVVLAYLWQKQSNTPLDLNHTFHLSHVGSHTESNTAIHLNESIPYLRPIHRLDLDTSGILCFALTSFMTKHLSQLFQKHHKQQLHKVYWALSPVQPQNKIDCISLKPPQTKNHTRSLPKAVKTYSHVDELYNALKYYTQLESMALSNEFEKHFLHHSCLQIHNHLCKSSTQHADGKQRWTTCTSKGVKAHTTLLHLGKTDHLHCFALQLHTGRTHQLRVHLQSIGYAIWGDPLYVSSYKEIISKHTTKHTTKHTKKSHLYLHAVYLSFIHPRLNHKIQLCASLPSHWNSTA